MTKDYPFLEAEDTLFAISYHLSESDFLGMVGGAGAYLKLIQDRREARKRGVNVPSLPVMPIGAEISLAEKMGVDERVIAAGKVCQYRQRIAGALDSLKLDRKLKAYAADQKAREAEVEASRQRERQVSKGAYEQILRPQG